MGSICDVPGVRVGHCTDRLARTGCTVIIPDHAAVCGADVRGSAPGTRELELLKPVRLIQKVHAILLSGGSAFGLDAAGGVQRYLEERDIGYDTGISRVPIVPAAVIFDLATGDPSTRPDKKMGYKACEKASNRESAEGLVGAGCGATVAKMAGYEKAVSGGVGTCVRHLEAGISVGVLTVVNSLGDIVDPSTNQFIVSSPKPEHPRSPFSAQNTTLSVVATDASLGKEAAIKVAQMAQDGIARAIRPAHTMYDGDVVFALSTGSKQADVNDIGSAAADLVAESIARAVRISNNL